MLVQYLLPCTECENKIPVSPRHAGGQLDCNECGKPVDVPKLGQLRQLETLNDGSAPGADLPRERNRTKGLLFSVGLILFVVAGLAAGTLYYMGMDRSVDVDVESRLQEQLAEFDDLKPAQLYQAWKQRPAQLGDWKELDFIRLNREGDVLKVFSYVTMGVAGFGLVLLLGSLMMSPTEKN